MDTRLIIAVAPPHQSELQNYTEWLEHHKLPYHILVPGQDVSEYGMLMLCGGADVMNPKSETRTHQELIWFKQAYGKLPIFGICRGLQLANIVLGGDLNTDIHTNIIHTANKELIAQVSHSQMESSWHEVTYNNERIKVNSRHHQGIGVIAEALTPLAVADDGIIEMVTGNNALFVQWHPERSEVRGSSCELIASQWICDRIRARVDYYTQALNNLSAYYHEKGFTVVSEERIRKSIDSSYSPSMLNTLIAKFPSQLKKVKDKSGKVAIKLMRNGNGVV
jgi:anthranilate/para-aminobenzoate synthase component II